MTQEIMSQILTNASDRFCWDWLWLPTAGQELSPTQSFPKATHLVAQRHWSRQIACGWSSAL